MMRMRRLLLDPARADAIRIVLLHRTHRRAEQGRDRRPSSHGLRCLAAGAILLVGILVARNVPAAMTPIVHTGSVSPVGWIFSGLSSPTLDAQGRAVFLASSSAAFARTGGVVTQRLGAGTTLGDGRTAIGANAPAVDANGCVLARVLLNDGGQAILRTCDAALTIVAETGDAVSAGTTIASLDPTVFAVGTETVAFSGVLSDGAGAILRRDAGGFVVIARLGQAAPTGGRFTTIRPLGVSAAGRVGFHAVVSQGPNGLFAGSGDSMEAVVVVGQGSPSGGAFSSLGDAAINPADRWVFRASLSSGVSGVFLADTAAANVPITTVALEGDPAPIEHAKFRGFPSSSTPSINAGGVMTFRGLLEGIDAGAAVFVAPGDGSLVPLVTTQQETQVGTLIQLRDPVIADDGSVVLPATVAGSGPSLYSVRDGKLSQLAQFGATTTGDVLDTRFRFASPSVRATAEGAAFLGERDGVFRRSALGAVEALAYTGERTAVDGFFAAFGNPVVDGRGRVVFGATIHQGAVKEAVFAYGDQGLAVLAKPGQRASGGGKYSDFFPSAIDDAGRPGAGPTAVALTASLKSTGADEGLFVFVGARGRAVVRTGQHVAGGRLTAFGTPALGPRRQVAFVAEIGGKSHKKALVAGGRGNMRVMAVAGGATGTRVASAFVAFDPPAMADLGAVFRATLSGQAQEGVFLAHGRSLVALAVASDVTTLGERIRTYADPVASGNVVYVLARLAGDDSPAGLYRIVADQLPAADGPQLPIEPLLRPGDPGPGGVGGVTVRIDQPGVGPLGSATAVVDLGGATASSALVWIAPDAAPASR
jgi:hypothetical protein